MPTVISSSPDLKVILPSSTSWMSTVVSSPVFLLRMVSVPASSSESTSSRSGLSLTIILAEAMAGFSW